MIYNVIVSLSYLMFLRFVHAKEITLPNELFTIPGDGNKQYIINDQIAIHVQWTSHIIVLF